MSSTRPGARAVWIPLAMAALAGLSACGGGGGGSEGGATQQISGTYQLDGAAELGVAGSIRAALPAGVSGTPHCTLTSGTVPPGMVFGTDCSLSGTPNRVGSYAAQLNFTVAGYSGAATVNVNLSVGGPLLAGNGLWGQPIELLAALEPRSAVAVQALGAYAAKAGDELRYALASGSLPPGLALDAATGQVSGAPQALGTFDASIGATLRRGGVDYALAPVPLQVAVRAPFGALSYPSALCCDLPVNVGTASIAAPTFNPALPAGAVAQFEATTALPAGLVVDAATGAIGGKTLVPGNYPLGLRATVQVPSGSRYTVDMPAGFWRLDVRGVLPTYPVSSNGSGNTAAQSGAQPYAPGRVEHWVYRFPVGNVTTVAPGAVFNGQAGDTYAYALVADPSTGAPPPAWVSVDEATGVVSAAAPADLPGQGTPVAFWLRTTTQRGADTIVSLQAWRLLVQ